jgi:transcriptional regulator of acetoin/glycerol metabolism
MSSILASGNHDLLRVEDHPTIQQIADTLAGAGLQAVRLDDLEQAALGNALAANNGNRTHAAHSLGISTRTLQRRLKKARGVESMAVVVEAESAASPDWRRIAKP